MAVDLIVAAVLAALVTVVSWALYAAHEAWWQLWDRLSQLDSGIQAVQRAGARSRRPQPLLIDFRLLRPLAASTQGDYRRALDRFGSWLRNQPEQLTPDTADDLLVTYLYEAGVRPSAAEMTVAGMEKVAPRLKGRLQYARATLSMMQGMHTRMYTAPLPLMTAVIIAYHWANEGRPRQGAALLVQWLFGLRPSEMLSQRGQRILPAACAEAGGYERRPMVMLQAQSRTKAGRPQFSMALATWATLADIVISAVKAATPAGTLITNVPSVTALTGEFRKAKTKLNLAQDFTAHSARPGWASESRLAGEAFTEIMEAGRWVSATSFRSYLDICAILLQPARDSQYDALATWLLADLRGRFPWA